MKANEFVKKYGLELSREIVSKQPKWASNVRVSEIIGTWEYTEKVLPSFSIVELKGLVESHELVASRGGLDAAKHELILLQKHLNSTFGYVTIITSEKIENLKQAIADVESCMEVK